MTFDSGQDAAESAARSLPVVLSEIRGAIPLLIVLSGPSGVGKDAVLNRMKALRYPFHFTVTMTTRKQRALEVDGVDYHFVSKEFFEDRIPREYFLEWANVYGNLYGVPRDQVRAALSAGRDVLIKADVQGAATIKSLAPNAVFIFLAPPSMDDLVQRLKERKTETAADMARRIDTARDEMCRLPLFDYQVVNENDKLDLAVAHIGATIVAEKCRLGVDRCTRF
ncbi:MAG: guanylate kinase [Chloroflexota bacterium]|nr:MAG: guanylate kinase [Chloroflexota bacterium]